MARIAHPIKGMAPVLPSQIAGVGTAEFPECSGKFEVTVSIVIFLLILVVSAPSPDTLTAYGQDYFAFVFREIRAG